MLLCASMKDNSSPGDEVGRITQDLVSANMKWLFLINLSPGIFSAGELTFYLLNFLLLFLQKVLWSAYPVDTQPKLNRAKVWGSKYIITGRQNILKVLESNFENVGPNCLASRGQGMKGLQVNQYFQDKQISRLVPVW